VINLKDIQLRETTASDLNDIIKVETLAFGYEKEAILTSELLSDKTAEPIISLLAFHNDKAVGHILFTKAYGADNTMMHILAPLAIVPEYQRLGIGGMLINEGLRLLKQLGSEIVFVLGHKEYYPKYGFQPGAESFGFPAPYDIPEKYADYWMYQVIADKEFGAVKGKIRCADALNKPEHWRE